MALISHLRSHRRLWVLVVLFLIPLAVLAICEIAGWPFLRGPAEKMLNRRMERPVRITEPFSLHLLGSLRLQAGGLWIAAPEAFDAPHFLDSEDIALKLRYRDLWHFRQTGDLRIASLEIGRMDALLLRNAEGDASWQFKKRDPAEPPPELPKVDLLSVRQGKLVFRDPTLDADLKATFDTEEGATSSAPIAHVEAQGKFRKRPFKGELNTNGWLPAAARSEDIPPMATKGWLTYGGVRADFDGSVQNLLGRQGIKGKVTVRGPSLGVLGQLFNSPLPTTAPFSIRGTIDKEDEVWRVHVENAHVGASDLAARFTYDPSPRPPRLEGVLEGSNLALADLAPTFGTRNEEGLPVPPRPGRKLPNRPLDLPSLKNLNARIAINLERVDLGSAFKEPLQPFRANLDLNGGQLGLAKVDARTARGRLSGEISVDARTPVPRWRSDLAWEGIHLEDWLKSGRDGGGRKAARREEGGPRTPYFTGILQGRAKLAGEGRSTAELLASLDGDVTLFVRNGTLSHLVIEVLGLDVAQGLGLAIAGDESLPMKCAIMDLQAKNGTLAPKVALVDTPVTLILADGTVNLAGERLDLRLTAKPKNFSPFTVRAPIRVRGSFSDPQAAPEAGPIAAKVLGGVALAFVNPLAAILPFIDPGDDTSNSSCAQALATLKR